MRILNKPIFIIAIACLALNFGIPFTIDNASASSSLFDQPEGIAISGSNLWITNSGNNSVTELNESNGLPVRTFSAHEGLEYPQAIAANGAHVWISSVGNHEVIEINASTGSIQRITYQFDAPSSIAVGRSSVWVTDCGYICSGLYGGGGSFATELDALTGSYIREVRDSGITTPYAAAINGSRVWIVNYDSSVTELKASSGAEIRFIKPWLSFMGNPVEGSPEAIAVSGTHVWIANAFNNSLSELDTSNGSAVRVINAPVGKLYRPEALAVSGSDLWIANCGTTNPCPPGKGSVTEVNASTGSLIKAVNSATDHFDGPTAIAASSSDVWIVNTGNNSVTELNAKDGALVRIIR